MPHLEDTRAHGGRAASCGRPTRPATVHGHALAKRAEEDTQRRRPVSPRPRLILIRLIIVVALLLLVFILVTAKASPFARSVSQAIEAGRLSA
jgi:membrane-associated protease RseP (regulator of RpoE activity)